MNPRYPSIPPEILVRQHLYGFRSSYLIFYAARLHIPELLQAGPQNAADVATKLSLDYPSVQRFMVGLAAIGVVAENWDGTFSLTPVGELLNPNHPDTVYPEVALGDLVLSRAWMGLGHTLETGQPGFDAVAGMSFYQFLQQNREFKNLFSHFMDRESQRIGQLLVTACSPLFSQTHRFVDVGGGVGTVAVNLCQAFPHLQGLVYEKAEMIMPAQGYLRHSGFIEQCRPMAGDFFQSVPAGGDVYILSQILHDWKDEECQTILRNCHRAMPPQGVLLIVEALMPQLVQGPSFAVEQDLIMFVLTHGRERTQEEYRLLVESAGFAVRHVAPTDLYSIIEAARV